MPTENLTPEQADSEIKRIKGLFQFTPIQIGPREPLKTAGAQRALAAIAAIKADPRHPYWEGAPWAIGHVYSLFRQAYGVEPTGLTVQEEEE